MLKITPFELKLKAPIEVTATQRITSRRGFQFFLTDPRGRGECCPLPGLHRESLEECLGQLRGIEGALETAEMDAQRFDLRSPYFNLIEPSRLEKFLGPDSVSGRSDRIDSALAPSLTYAIEESLLTGYLAAHPSAWESLFGVTQPRFSTLVNGLIVPSADSLKQLDEVVRTIHESGFKTLKIKVGRLPQAFEAEFLRRLSTSLGSEFSLRLDGNQSFSEDAFFKFCSLVGDLPIEYFEEPLPATSYAAYERSVLPIALDESVPTYFQNLAKGLTPPSTVQALVIKPSVLGGIYECVRIIDHCNNYGSNLGTSHGNNQGNGQGLKCVLSSAYDTGWNIRTYSLLAQRVKIPTAMGFDTYKYLDEDTCAGILGFEQGTLWANGSEVLNGPNPATRPFLNEMA